MIVLKTLSVGPLHGYAIAQQIKLRSGEVFDPDEGSLYPALQRMRQKGWITGAWGQTPNKQRARYYSITPAGRKQLGEEETSFDETIAAVRRLMRA
jgi:PadR family transcriptional regulator, regulatory protein PadR